jgi:hypothetical protein
MFGNKVAEVAGVSQLSSKVGADVPLGAIFEVALLEEEIDGLNRRLLGLGVESPGFASLAVDDQQVRNISFTALDDGLVLE